LDLMLVEISSKATICGLLTQSQTCSAAVKWCRKNLKGNQNQNKPIGIIVNSGNANVFTGRSGEDTVNKTILSVAQHLNTVPQNIFVASTGVIGELLDPTIITSRMDQLVSGLKPQSFGIAAEAIMTTDTYSKGVHQEICLDGIPIKINGIAKGSGMIAPDMATMLAFIFSDISIERDVLQEIVTACNKTSFNSITVDSDTSTSDSLFVVATGKAPMTKIKSLEDPRAKKFYKFLSKAMLDLAHLVVKDGEGITKYIEIIVKGSESPESAFKVGKSIAESPLVKTAFAGEDPNWGRVVMAIGKSGIKIDKEKISIWFGNHLIAQNGSISESYNEPNVAKYMKNDSLVITVDLGLGNEKSSIYTCDLTHDYISINADYRS
jgi:glutamate N-acetyltransferase/amino-acid N-acetyltransferase